jgi:hypothetical protein
MIRTSHGALHPESRRMAAQARLRRTLAVRQLTKPGGPQRGPQVAFQLPKDTDGGGVAATGLRAAPRAAPLESLDDLEAQFQELNGDVDALVRRLQLPPEVAAAAREYAATDEQHRDIDRIVGSLTALPQ